MARSTSRTGSQSMVALLLCGALALGGCALVWNPLTDTIFGGRPALTIALMAGLVGYAVSYFARGIAGGVRWFGGYGLVLLADGAIRMLVAMPLIFIASPTIAAIAIAAAAIGGALAPLASRRRDALRRVEGAPGDPYPIGSAVRFAAPAAVIAGCEQILVSGGPLLVLIAGGPNAAAAAGVLFAATLMVRAPVFLFQGVQASLLPNLATFQANGDHARLHRATALTALATAGLAGLLALGALAAGPAVMTLLFGDGFVAARTDLVLLSLGIGGFLAACTFNQALLARGHAVGTAVRWCLTAVAFVAIELAVPGSEFHRVSVAFAAASTLIAALLMAAVWRQR